MRASISFIPLSRQTAVLILLLFVATATYSQITPSQDAYTNTASPATNYGVAVTLGVVNSATSIQTTYIQFDLSSIPAGYKSSNIAKATLKLYVNAVTTAGSFNIDFVNGTWTEKKVTSNLAPALGTTIMSSVPLTSANVKDYVLVDITAAVGAWLDGTQANDGIALVANSPLSATFDSKENSLQSQPPEIDIVFAGGGTITGVTTASGSGLMGGGTSGTLNLSLLTSCSSGQVLKWSGSAWACASLSGGGTITGVTAGTDLKGGGTSGVVTLNLDTTKVPQLATANTFTGNQTVNGNLSATGVVTGNSFQIGSNLFAFGSYANLNAFLGFAGNTTMTGGSNTGSGSYALVFNTTGWGNTAVGSDALEANRTGIGNTASGYAALLNNTAASYNTANGFEALVLNTTGVYNTATGSSALSSNTVGSYNVGVGSGALQANVGDSAQDGWYNTAVGVQALYSNNDTSGAGSLATQNAAVGYQALKSNTNGYGNTANGYQALTQNTTGWGNTASGSVALYANTQGFGNTATGVWALDSNTTGTANTAVGANALQSNQTGSLLTCVGYSCYTSVDGLQNATAIGAYATISQSNTLVLGWNVNVGIGTSTPDNLLTVNGSADKPGGGSWGTYSDRRLKTVDGGFNSGLREILRLHPVRYRYNKENALGIQDSQEHVGLVAQDVQAVIPEAVTENNKGYLLLNNDPILWSMLNAIKEQQALIQKQQEQIARLTRQVKTIQATLKVNGQSGSAIRTVKAEATTVRQ